MCDAVTQFNNGAKGRKRLYETLNLNVGINGIKGLQREEKTAFEKRLQRSLKSTGNVGKL